MDPAASSPSSPPAYFPNRIADPRYVRILDTTLRDGEQAPGAAMTAEQKLSVARLLFLLRVDVIEAGFPAASPEDLEAVRAIANEVGTRAHDDGHMPIVGGVARSNKRDIDAVWEAVKGAARPRIMTFLATSDIHMEHKLKMTRGEVVAKATEMVAYARSLGCQDVSFAAEDAGRSDRQFLYHVLEEVIKAGATTVIIPDTVGYNLPSEFGQLIADIKSNTRGIDNAIVAAHCHNDLGLATANTLAAAEAGARQLEVSVNGIGERAGNAALEEVVMAIKSRKKLLDFYTGINTKHILPTSKLVMECTGLHVQPHKAIVGVNAFAHESGIHQDGILKFRGTYEILSPEDIGSAQSNRSGIVLGKLSGRHAIKARLMKLGYDINGEELDDIFKQFKEVAKRKKRITDDDIKSLVIHKTIQSNPMWSLGSIQVTHGNVGFSTATVKLISLDGKEEIACSVGKGPVDASYKAINSIVQVPVTLVEQVSSTEEGDTASASTRVVICEQSRNLSMHNPPKEENCRNFSGEGKDADIVISSVQAYLNAINRMLASNDLSAIKLSNGKV